MHQIKSKTAPGGRFRFTIKTIVFGALGALALLAVGKIGWEASQSWQAYLRALDQREFSAAADQFIKGTYDVLLERLTTDNALQAPGAADGTVAAKIEGHRKVVRELYDPGLAAIEQRSFPNRKALIDDLKSKVQKANDVRRQADSAIKLSREQRDENFRKTFRPIMTEMVNASLNIWYAAVYATAKGDSELAQLAVIKEIGWKMREFSGLARAAVAGAIAGGNPIPLDRVALMQEYRARVDALWMVLQNLANDSRTDPAIIEAMRQAQDRYFKGFLPRSEDMRKAGEAGKYPLTAAQWVETTNPQIDSLLAVMQAAGKASDTRNQHLIDAAFGKLAIELAMLIICVAIVLGCVAVVLFQVTRPLTALSGAMRELANGNFDVVLPGLGRRNEVGDMAEAVELFKIKAADKVRLEAEAKQAEEARQAAERKADMHRLANEFEAAVGNIVDTVSSASTQLETAARTLTTTAETTQQLSATVASSSEEASASVESVACATEEMSSSVREIARQVQESSRIADEAVDQAEKTDARIAELSKAASRIGDVVKLITAIAEQTNLLALNATIEAARAGEAGRGFAVVAQEVKALAAQTAKATDEIGTQISSMQAATRDSVGAIKEIGGTIGRISEIASAIAAAVEEQGAATQEISRNVQQASDGTKQVAASITDVNRGAGETGSASAQVLASAQSLSSESFQLKREVETFLMTVRAA
jgi:methyl-accepting chemotaxis protein